MMRNGIMPLICNSPRHELQALHEKLIRKGLVQNTPLRLPTKPVEKPKQDARQ